MLTRVVDYPGRGQTRCVLFRKGDADEVDVDVECNMHVMYREELGNSDENIRGQKGLDLQFGKAAGMLEETAKQRASAAEAARPDLEAVLEAVKQVPGGGAGRNDAPPAAGKDAQPGQAAGIGGSDSDSSDDEGGGNFISNLLSIYGGSSSGGGGGGGGGSGKSRRVEKAASLQKAATVAGTPNKREKSAGAPPPAAPAPSLGGSKVCILRLTYFLWLFPLIKI